MLRVSHNRHRLNTRVVLESIKEVPEEQEDNVDVFAEAYSPLITLIRRTSQGQLLRMQQQKRQSKGARGINTRVILESIKEVPEEQGDNVDVFAEANSPLITLIRRTSQGQLLMMQQQKRQSKGARGINTRVILESIKEVPEEQEDNIDVFADANSPLITLIRRESQGQLLLKQQKIKSQGVRGISKRRRSRLGS
ncbi:unnamed protein product [Meganyctiphanes norvegica]|uniref:Uncharacterized protein n=1 Tax=Meganyctiphanes norvegica TaxID=48144 RepID=A0AAV2SFD4_MEGNR